MEYHIFCQRVQQEKNEHNFFPNSFLPSTPVPDKPIGLGVVVQKEKQKRINGFGIQKLE